MSNPHPLWQAYPLGPKQAITQPPHPVLVPSVTTVTPRVTGNELMPSLEGWILILLLLLFLLAPASIQLERKPRRPRVDELGEGVYVDATDNHGRTRWS